MTIVLVTVGVNGALWRFTVIVRAGEASGAVSSGTDTVLIGTTLGPGIHLIADMSGAVNIDRPITHRSNGVHVAGFEKEYFFTTTQAASITSVALEKASLVRRTTFPESAAV